MKAKIALQQGDDRYRNIRAALEQVADQIDLRDRKSVLIKPNLVSPSRQLANTHIEAVRAVLDFLRENYDGLISIAEGGATEPIWGSFQRFGYSTLAESCQVPLVDLNSCDWVTVKVYNRKMESLKVRLARPLVESDFRISICPPKTHDFVQVTLSLKNIIMGSLVNPAMADGPAAGIHDHSSGVKFRLNQGLRLLRMLFPGDRRSDKFALHQGYPVMNLNLAMLASWVKPHLSVIDGFQGMEADGPRNGPAVDWHIALAGTDPVAVDHLSSHLMGFDPSRIGYLNYCKRLGLGVGDLNEIEVSGTASLETIQRAFQPPPTFEKQRKWELDAVERWLNPAEPA